MYYIISLARYTITISSSDMKTDKESTNKKAQ